MTYDLDTSIRTFLDASAARQPTPGGGAVAALTGALAASMGEMVLNYSVNKKGLEHFQSELKPALEKFHNARKIMEALVVEDQAAYEAVTVLRKLPADSPERAAQWPGAVLTAARVPQTVTATAIAILELCDEVVNFVNPMLLSDLSVSADLAMATARCGVYNVRINLPDIADEAERRKLEDSLMEVMQRASKVIQRVTPRIWERIAQESR